jgi:tetratricopeptide (TPR) repeat protein
MIKLKYLILCQFVLLLFIEVFVAQAKVPDVVLKQKEAVVTISIYENEKLLAYGSGFIIDPDGIVATNHHVVSLLFENPDTSIAIRMANGDFVKAQKMLSFDKTNDVALLKVEGKGLPSLLLSQDYKPKQGDDVFVIGSPFGLETSISNGIISSIRGTDEFLQITAPISAGSSGSPVLNINGEVIGIATLIIESGQNLNFAIPIKYITNIQNKLPIKEAEPLKATMPSLTKSDNKKISVETHLNLAKEHFKEKRWDEAIEEYTKAISMSPQNASLYFARGRIYLELIKVVPQPPKPAEAPAFTQEDTYSKFVQEIHGKNVVFWNKTIEDFSNAIALQPDNVIFYYFRSGVYRSKEEYEIALKDIDKAISLKPDISFLYYERGLISLDLKKYEKAIDDFSKAINLKPNRELFFSIFYSPLKEFGLIEKEFDEVMKYVNKPLSELYYYLARSYEKNLQMDEAIRYYEKSISGGYWSGVFFLNKLYEKENRLKDAVKFYSNVINLNPKDGDLYVNRAYFYKKLEQFNKALQDYSKAIEVDPEYYFYYSKRGDLYKTLKQYKNAIKDYTKVITLKPDYPEDYFSRGQLYAKLNQNDKALDDYKKACNKGSEYACDSFTELSKEIKRGKKWVFFGSAGKSDYYYDKTSIKKLPKKHIQVWTRQEREDASSLIELRKSNLLPYKGYENLSHSLSLWKFDCGSQQMAVTSGNDYYDKGNILSSYSLSTDKIEMSAIVPDSISESLYKTICEGKKE